MLDIQDGVAGGVLFRLENGAAVSSFGSKVPWGEIGVRTGSTGTRAPVRRRPAGASSPSRVPKSVPATEYVLPATFEQSVWVERPTRNGIRLHSPLVRVEVGDADRDGVFIASDAFSTVYGAGDSVDAAIDDYLDALFDHFDALDRQADRLGLGPREELAVLRQHLYRTP